MATFLVLVDRSLLALELWQLCASLKTSVLGGMGSAWWALFRKSFSLRREGIAVRKMWGFLPSPIDSLLPVLGIMPGVEAAIL